MEGDMDQTPSIKVMPDKFRATRVGSLKTAAWCSLCMGILGLGLMIGGAVLSGIAFTEQPPPMDDTQYNRFRGSDPRRVVGPLMLALGCLLLFGSIFFVLFAVWSSNRDEHHRGMSSSTTYYNARTAAEAVPPKA